jgi:DNA-directed RNA polymerase specialized sigma24 family protein
MVSELSATGAVPSSVVAAAVSGDTVAFARIVHAHHNDMARVCRVVCGDIELAQDATQAAGPIAWRRLRTLMRSGRRSSSLGQNPSARVPTK